MSGRDPAAPTTLAGRLDALIRGARSTDGQTLTNENLADALKAVDPSLKVSGAYLSALRTGKRTHPSADLQLALARHFDVPVSYLVDLGGQDDFLARVAELDQAAMLGVRSIALRAIGLDEDGLNTVAAVLDHVRRLQGLPPVPDQGDPPGAERPDA